MLTYLKRLLGLKKQESALPQPEDLFIIEITDLGIVVKHPKQATETMNWGDIETITLANTDVGPILPDIWMILSGQGNHCAIPQSSKGYDEIYQIVSNYVGFNFDNVTASSTCLENQTFRVWSKY